MSAAIQQLEIFVDEEDLEALAKDIARIFETYGPEDECAPHLQRARAIELRRARETFRECVKATNAG